MTKLQELENYLSEIDAKIHLNGDYYPTAILTVDVGQSIKNPVELSNSQLDKLSMLMKDAAYEVSRRRGEVRTHADTSSGIFWASIQ